MLRGKIPHFRLTCVAQKRRCFKLPTIPVPTPQHTKKVNSLDHTNKDTAESHLEEISML